jgi:hypothetical protein
MNAYELADTLNECIDDGSTDLYCVCHAAKMLRQQADRIAHLEMLVANRNEIIDKLDLTKPQTKELSGAEIVRISKTCDLNHVLGLIDFARAILKKASDK